MLGLSHETSDKLGHFFRGLVLALAAREILLRGGYVRGHKMGFPVCCVVRLLGATYEPIEWWAAGDGTGVRMIFWGRYDPWDTQF